MKESVIEKMSYEFAIEIVKLCKKLKELNEFEFKTQLFRSGTSIGANITEAETSSTKREYIEKTDNIYRVLSSIILTTKKKYNL